MLTSRDSWSAVASPMVAARAGNPRRTAVPATRAAWSACVTDRYQVRPSAVAAHRSATGVSSSRRLSATTTAPVPTAATTRRVTAARRGRRRRARARPASGTSRGRGSGVLVMPGPWCSCGGSVRVQRGVELDARAGARDRLDPAREGVAPEEDAGTAREVARLDDERGARVVGLPDDGHLGPGGDVQAGLDDAVVTERDAEAGVGPEEGAPADGDDLAAAAGERAHDGRAAADVGPVADHDARGDAALDHRGAERARVEVDEALVHHGRAGGEVRAEAHAVGVGDADARGDDVVDHARELVHAVHGDGLPGGAQAQPRLLEAVDGARAVVGPHDVGEDAEEPVEVEPVRHD